MNLPNKLTVLRVIMIPFFVYFVLVDPKSFNYRLIAEAIFIIASFTDLLDGKIARKYNLVTNFGKFMDPLAYKLLVSSALICLLSIKSIPTWVVIVIIAREFIISGFRLVAANNNIVIAANQWGKWKTAMQMAMIVVLILNIKNDIYMLLANILIYVSAALTVISLITYLAANKDILKEQN